MDHTSNWDDIVSQLAGPLEWDVEAYGDRYRNDLLPSRRKVIEVFDELRSVLFPGYFGYREFTQAALKNHLGATLDRAAHALGEEIQHACRFVNGWEYERDYAKVEDTDEIVARFLSKLPEIRQLLVKDAQMCYEWDPAVFIPEAPIFCYPNMLAMMYYRLAHQLYKEGVPFIPRIVTEHAHGLTGIDIHPGAEIGESFFIDHGTGVVIGQTTIVGNRVRLYQGVTLGAIRFPLDEKTQRPLKGVPRHPIIEDDVVIYAEATVLGRITVGARSIIGANVFLAKSVKPESKVFAPPVRVSQIKKGDTPSGEAVGGG